MRFKWNQCFWMGLLLFCAPSALLAQGRTPASSSEVIDVRIGTPGIAYPYSYLCNSSSKPDPKGTRVCGVEVDLFNRICEEMNMRCTWVIHPLSGAPGADPMTVPGGLLYDLINPSNGGSADHDSSYPYDVVVSSISTNSARRMQMLFTIPYYTASNILIGDIENPLFKKSDLDRNGFPADRSYFPAEPGRKLKIGVLPGDLFLQVSAAYPNPKHVEIIKTGTFDQDLVNGKVDIVMAWNGVEKKIRDTTNGGGNTRFGVVSLLKIVHTDTMNAVGMASRISKSGRRLSELFNQGILKARTGNGGYHKQLFMKTLGFDLWACQSAPYVHGDPKCGDIPE